MDPTVKRASGPLRLHHPGPALFGFAVYFALCTLLGEFYPFSRYEMYAHGNHSTGVKLVVLADEEQVRLRDFSAFEGFDGADLQFLTEVGGGQRYQIDAVRHHILTHPAPPGHSAAHGPGVRLRVGYVLVHATEEGAVAETEFHLLSEGRAWPND